MFAAAVVAAMAGAPGTADAAQAARTAGPGAYDGTWNVLVHHPGRQLQLDQQRSVHGVGPPGFIGRRRQGHRRHQPRRRVAVQISVGASVASGSGRLAGNSGAGRWSGIITGDRCSGTWQATR